MPKACGSRTEVPRLTVRTWLHIAAYADRSPRLTLKAGCKEGCKAGRGRTALKVHLRYVVRALLAPSFGA
jgi:hypothetical protein